MYISQTAAFMTGNYCLYLFIMPDFETSGCNDNIVIKKTDNKKLKNEVLTMCSIQNNNFKSRLVWLDLLKGFCMIMIVLNHTSNRAEIYRKLYVPVFLSSFFFASGYTFKPREDFKHYFISKIKSLGIPFICLGLINAFLAILAEGDLAADRLKYLISIRLVWDDLWFVACLFTMQFIFYVIYKISGILENKFRINGCLTIAVFSFVLSAVSCKIVSITDIRLPLQFENACICTFSMALGYIYKMNEHIIDNIAIRVRGGQLLLITAYVILCIFINNSVGVHEAYYQSLLLYYVESVIGLISLISFCKLLGNNIDKKLLTPFIFIGQNTLVYYAFQSKGIKMFELIFNMLGVTSDTYLLPIITTVLVCICLAVPAYIINKWFPFLLGKRNTGL